MKCLGFTGQLQQLSLVADGPNKDNLQAQNREYQDNV
jgi:hypothetical protein